MSLDNLAQFNKEVGAFAATVPEKVSQLQAAIALEALKRIVEKTPVDTARARGNWQTTIGTPASEVLDETDMDGMATVQKGAAAIAELPPYQVVWISNNLDYIEFLEDGSSQQSPAGMVATTVEELRQMFK
ncbi:MAG: HK97 gp10 family phage protein [Planctomycetota bacterium]|nr:MAG: HK97 gp10 family phage protein [Planctomycetota bacterium]